jgi:hypothetical protein
MSTKRDVCAIVEEKSDTFVDYLQKLYYRELGGLNLSLNLNELIWASECNG